MGEKLAINRWAEEDRPREKMAHHGVAALSNAELLAILIAFGKHGRLGCGTDAEDIE